MEESLLKNCNYVYKTSRTQVLHFNKFLKSWSSILDSRACELNFLAISTKCATVPKRPTNRPMVGTRIFWCVLRYIHGLGSALVSLVLLKDPALECTKVELAFTLWPQFPNSTGILKDFTSLWKSKIQNYFYPKAHWVKKGSKNCELDNWLPK